MIFILSVFFLVVLLSHAATPLLVEDNKRTLSVSANGEMLVRPDICYVNLRVKAEDVSAAVAYKKNKDITVKVLNALQSKPTDSELGLAKADFQTTQISLNPQYSHRQRGNGEAAFDHYNAELTLTIKVRVLYKVSKVLDLAVESGAQIDSMIFAVEKPEMYEAEARKKAYVNNRSMTFFSDL